MLLAVLLAQELSLVFVLVLEAEQKKSTPRPPPESRQEVSTQRDAPLRSVEEKEV